MTDVGEADSSLATQCLALCQALTSQGMAFNFSLSIGSTFSCSLDTRSKEALPSETKKKASPSTLRRNMRRREEFFNKKKSEASEAEKSESDKEASQPATFPCDQCDNVFKSEKSLKIHIGKGHKTAEKIRRSSSDPLSWFLPLGKVVGPYLATTVVGICLLPIFAKRNQWKVSNVTGVRKCSTAKINLRITKLLVARCNMCARLAM